MVLEPFNKDAVIVNWQHFQDIHGQAPEREDVLSMDTTLRKAELAQVFHSHCESKYNQDGENSAMSCRSFHRGDNQWSLGLGSPSSYSLFKLPAHSKL